jgi:hypothetical protein
VAILWDLKVISTMIIFSISLFGSFNEPIDLNGQKEIISDQNQNNEIDFLDSNNDNSILPIVSNENDEHGGSWVDSFEDSSGIDWTNSDHLTIINDEIKINRGFPKTFTVDSYTRALWHFDEGTGSTTNDETTNNNDGTITGATWTTGKFSNCIDYNGGSDRVEMVDHASLDFGASESITIEAWAKTSDNRASILIKYIEDINNPGYYNIGTTSSGKAFFVIRCTNNILNSVISTTQITDNNWHFLVGVRDTTSDILKIYVDGQLENTTTDTTTGAISTPAPLKFGKYTGGSAENYNGLTDEVRLSNITRFPSTWYANLTSKPMNLPKNKIWDSLIFKKTQPMNTNLNVTILNATNNQQIPGNPKYTNEGEFDISYIDGKIYPSIKLNATFTGNSWGLTPKLDYWGVSWNSSDSWQDTLFGGLKIGNMNMVSVIDGNATFQDTGSLRSKIIQIPNNCYYNTLKINKTESLETYLNVSILDGQSNSIITGFTDLTGNEIDISGIDPQQHTSIKLRATYSSSGQDGILHNWSINWTNNRNPKILDVNSLQSINRTHSLLLTINVSDFEELEKDLILNVEYKEPEGTNWQTEYLTNPVFQSDHWECSFNPIAESKLGLYSFKFVCFDTFQYSDTYQNPYYIDVINNHPQILNISIEPPEYELNRTMTREILVNVSDVETLVTDLNVGMKFKSQSEITWNSIDSKTITFQDNYWRTYFTPSKTANTGEYIINITCSDSINSTYKLINLLVKNNFPTPPNVVIFPINPRTTEDIWVELYNPYDIETDEVDLTFWYRWYCDNFFMTLFENKTTIPSSETVKGQVWRCVVYIHDDDDLGGYDQGENTIVNSPPELFEPFYDYVMFEDEPEILENKLTSIFKDADQDLMAFSVDGNENLTVEIKQENGTIEITPEENWFGTETMTFSASDGSQVHAEETVTITVLQMNDLPRIVKVGSQPTDDRATELEFVTKQGDWLNLSVFIEDIDGDVERGIITFIPNITERINFYFDDGEKTLIFNPTNADVGWHFINITVTDNNETPTEFVSQHIRIRVRNVNDPPTVMILEPFSGADFYEKQNITFNCTGFDIDLLVWNSNEKLTYRWEWVSNTTDYGVLGKDRVLTINSLEPAKYYVTVEVTDSSGVTTYDSVNITIKTIPKLDIDEPSTKTKFNFFMVLGLIILIVIIVVVILSVFILSQIKKKKKRAELGISEGHVLQPDASYLPSSAPSDLGVSKSPQLVQPQMIGTKPLISATIQSVESLPSSPPAIQSQPQVQAQLPSAHTPLTAPSTTPIPVSTDLRSQEQYKSELKLSSKEKIELLEERLLRGEIDQDLFENLKAKYELEYQQYKEPPQLPPATRIQEQQPSIQSLPQQQEQVKTQIENMQNTPKHSIAQQPTIQPQSHLDSDQQLISKKNER